MKIFILHIFIITILLIHLGCASNPVKKEMVEVQAKSPTLKTAVIELPKDEFEEINKYAYDHYVFGLILESDNPPDIYGAADHYKQALQYHPNSYQIRYSLADAYFRLRQPQDALEVLSVIQPVDANVYNLKGRSFIILGMADSAQYSFTELAKMDPNSGIAYHYLSQLYRNNNQIDSLIWSYENLARLIPNNYQYWQELGKLKAQKGEYAEAKESFQKSLQASSENENLLSYVGLAEMYKVEERYDSALQVYMEAIKVSPDNIPLNADISMLYAQVDSFPEAIPYARKVVEFMPEDNLYLRRFGIICYGADSMATADSVFTVLVNRGERDPINHFYLGRIAINREDYRIAVEEFKILTQLADTVVGNWLDLGYAYRKTDDLSHEILTYKTGINAMQNEVDSLKLLFALGAVYERADMFDSSAAAFELILVKEPDNHQALNYLGYMLADLGQDLDYALKLIRKAVDLSPDNAAYLDSYGWVYYKLEDYDKAIKYLKQAVALQNDPVLFDHLGDAYFEKGEHEQAGVWWKKSLELDPENQEVKEKLEKKE